MWISSKDAAKYLGITPEVLSQMRHKKQGPKFYKPAGKIFYKHDDLDAYVMGKENEIDV